jgi:hypothetical protein
MRNMFTGNLLARPGREIERSAVGNELSVLTQAGDGVAPDNESASGTWPERGGPLIPHEG